ncbi:unnamed protein product [Bemisia tabaci]|uniref:E3 ubiquitin-protein ligase RNF25 n=1 Tax=Bemisia tabaci TaxID=7038 RepID=A0A9P0F924_BEMTA|nr:PREDICTED: E3 ubiquitin-protein ligase RNF25 [Bemisia tabaci]CAH0394930.1 unnamed protein product [Bemisia tabaci]
MNCDERLAEELEALQAILMDEIIIKTDSDGNPTGIEMEVLPVTDLDTDEQYVTLTLDVTLPVGYPDVTPIVKFRNPRGLADSTLDLLKEQISNKCAEYSGSPVLYEIIELVREGLTASNIPCCPCCICLYGFRPSDHFTKTQCYHYFHSNCLANHIISSEQIFIEEQDKLPPWQKTDEFHPVCPVCRANIKCDLEALKAAPPSLDLTEAPQKFEPSEELRLLQQRMSELFNQQKQRGGTIQQPNNTIILSSNVAAAVAERES